VENLLLRCRAHNAYEAQRPFWAAGFARAACWVFGSVRTELNVGTRTALTAVIEAAIAWSLRPIGVGLPRIDVVR
jgi:hypothetical protein